MNYEVIKTVQTKYEVVNVDSPLVAIEKAKTGEVQDSNATETWQVRVAGKAPLPSQTGGQK